MSIIGETNTSRLGDSLETYRYIDCVAKNIAIIFDNVADINADPEFDVIIWWYGRITFGHAMLNIDRAPYRIHDAVEFR